MENKNRKSKILIIIGVLAVSSVFYLIGFKVGLQKAQTKIVYQENPPINADFSLFWKVWDSFRQSYIHSKDLTDEDVLYGAIAGIVNSANDPYSAFFKPSDAKKFEEDLNGSFGGIGAEIDIRSGQLIIVAPLKETPAEKAGLRSGDEIIKIDEIFSNTLTTVEEAVKIIRGPEGTSVVLSILRKGWDSPREIPIVRGIINIPTLDWEMKENRILYVHLYNFNENAPLSFYKAVFSAMLNGAQGVVLDLRDNPGGYLEVAVDIAGWFLEKGEIVVKEEFSSGQQEILSAEGNGALADVPTVVLINQGSASASEILAGALRDNRNIILVGETTFGKGTVQELKKFSDDSEMKITVAQWVLPNGDVIDKKGLTPDIEVKTTEDDTKNERDPQLEKALETLKAEIKK